MHTMLFLPAAALCWLGSALAAMATQLVQDDLTLTRREGESVSFSCGTGQCGYDEYRYWYQKKETSSYYCSCLVWSSTVRNNSFSLNKNLQILLLNYEGPIRTKTVLSLTHYYSE
uniref:Immunoglobulin V-set domain-containing protein n=1 Tax=Poecilia formosa TaxID=48698 RepID=A0A096M2U2_POEFO